MGRLYPDSNISQTAQIREWSADFRCCDKTSSSPSQTCWADLSTKFEGSEALSIAALFLFPQSLFLIISFIHPPRPRLRPSRRSVVCPSTSFLSRTNHTPAQPSSLFQHHPSIQQPSITNSTEQQSSFFRQATTSLSQALTIPVKSNLVTYTNS